MISDEQLRDLSLAVESHDFLARVRFEIEALQKVVFHDLEGADWNVNRVVAEQILIAEIVLHHTGELDGVYHALRQRERQGQPWALAIRDVAASIQSYFTTPLGLKARQELFGPLAAFLTPEAPEWLTARSRPAEEA
jgi:hypothetical protein